VSEPRLIRYDFLSEDRDMRIPNQSAGVERTAFLRMIPASRQEVIPAGVLDLLCNWFDLPWCDEPKEQCIYDRTDTSCWGVVLMCKNRGWTASGRPCSGGWYACGTCLGFPW
jgi:hypothetical protein